MFERLVAIDEEEHLLYAPPELRMDFIELATRHRALTLFDGQQFVISDSGLAGSGGS